MQEEDLLRLAQVVPFDALIVGSGVRSGGGSIHISHASILHGLNRAFIDEYAPLAKDDVVGLLFAAYPSAVQVIPVSKYRTLQVDAVDGHTSGCSAGRKIADYLERHGIRHLMLTGLESSHGLAWITFYRMQLDRPFTAIDVENARFQVPGMLFRWQTAYMPAFQAPTPPTALLPLTVRETNIAIMKANGALSKCIAHELGIKVSTVEDTLKTIKRRLGIAGKKMSPQDIQNYHEGLR